MTNQQAFDRAAKHLLKQRKRAERTSSVVTLVPHGCELGHRFTLRNQHLIGVCTECRLDPSPLTLPGFMRPLPGPWQQVEIVYRENRR